MVAPEAKNARRVQGAPPVSREHKTVRTLTIRTGCVCSQVPALKFTPRADVDLLEKQLRKSICAHCFAAACCHIRLRRNAGDPQRRRS